MTKKPHLRAKPNLTQASAEGSQETRTVERAAPLPKLQQLANLLLRDQGATINQIIELTGWLPHTARAAISGLRKRGYGIDSDKVDGIRTYRAVAPR